VTESLHASLRNLRTEYVDLLQCHRHDPETPLEETVRAMEDLVRQGKVHAWGVSVWTGAEIEEGLRVAREVGGYGPVSNQPSYSLLDRSIETEIVPTCRRLGIGQIVFSPLAQGVLTGKYAGGRPAGSRAADPQRGRFMEPFLAPATLAKVEEFVGLAREAGTTPARLALAWCLAQPGVDAVIVGATRPEQVRENVGASGLAVPPDLLRALDGLFPPPAAG
jgi:aryl-alcohol dehydrogenase-like predicted oxidoreductase